jgi:uncharacterized membrane protein HdeD (DUF308 family)
MQPEESGTALPPAFAAVSTWQANLVAGIITLILGLIVSFHPSTSLNVIAVLIGLLLIISGIFHLVRMFSSAESHRVWLGISGLLLVVLGVVLVRHLHLTVALIGLIVGISWIVQGLSALAVSLGGEVREGRGGWIFFGIVSLIGGIVVTAFPTNSVTVLAVLVGIWFIIEGLLEIISAFMIRRMIHKEEATVVSSPRAGEGAATL